MLRVLKLSRSGSVKKFEFLWPFSKATLKTEFDNRSYLWHIQTQFIMEITVKSSVIVKKMALIYLNFDETLLLL